MSGTLPWSQAPPAPATNDPNETLRRIEVNTAGLLTWMKILVGAVVVLILVTVFVY